MINWKNYDVDGQMNLFDLGIWSGKTSAEPSVQTVEKISVSSLKKPRESQTKQPLFLNLRRGSGLLPDVSWETDGVWLGELRITNFGEHPNVDVESRLSQILEVNVPPKFYLSATACLGILRRADKRGKELPKLLKDTLMKQAATPSKLGGGAEFDRYGKRAGKGALIQTELSGTLGVSQDQTLITLEGNGSRDSHKGDGYRESNIMYTPNTVEQHSVCYGINGDVAGTLDANYYKGCGEREGTEREVVCIGNGQVAQAAMSNQVGALNCMHDQQAVMVYGLDRASFNQGQNAQYDFAVEKELAPTVLAKGPGGGY